jgi:hypothetical protein
MNWCRAYLNTAARFYIWQKRLSEMARRNCEHKTIPGTAHKACSSITLMTTPTNLLCFTNFHRTQVLTHMFLLLIFKVYFFLQNHTQFLAKEIVLPSLTAPISKVKTTEIPQKYSTLVKHEFHFKLSLQISSAWNIDQFFGRHKHSWTVMKDFRKVKNGLRLLEICLMSTPLNTKCCFLDIWHQWKCTREEHHALLVNWFTDSMTAVHLKTAVEPLTVY